MEAQSTAASVGAATEASGARTASKKIRSRIDSDKEAMQVLHETHGWVPGRDHIRPTRQAIADKTAYLFDTVRWYGGECDAIWDLIFDFDTVMNDDGKLVVAPGVVGDDTSVRSKFSLNRFPYEVPRGTRHSVMWYTHWPPHVDDKRIDADISKALEESLGHDDFDYVWYVNPKMTIASVFHVQVFWHAGSQAGVGDMRVGAAAGSTGDGGVSSDAHGGDEARACVSMGRGGGDERGGGEALSGPASGGGIVIAYGTGAGTGAGTDGGGLAPK